MFPERLLQRDDHSRHPAADRGPGDPGGRKVPQIPRPHSHAHCDQPKVSIRRGSLLGSRGGDEGQRVDGHDRRVGGEYPELFRVHAGHEQHGEGGRIGFAGDSLLPGLSTNG